MSSVDAPVVRESAEPDPDASSCLKLYSQLAAGVCVVTVAGQDVPLGMTASTVTSVSLRPPLLLACLQTGSRTLSWIEQRGSFGVQLLRADQQSLAKAFARPGNTAAVEIGYREVLGVPILPACLAWSVCRVEDARLYGDHVVVVGRVVAAIVNGGRPLVWHDHEFAELAAFAPAPLRPRSVQPASLQPVVPAPRSLQPASLQPAIV